MLDPRPRSHSIAWIHQALTVLMWAWLLAARREVRGENAPQQGPVDRDGITVMGTHDIPPMVDHFDLPRTICTSGIGGHVGRRQLRAS